MRSFTIQLIIAALAAFTSAAPIVNGNAFVKDVAPSPLSDGHQSLGSSVSTRNVADNIVGQLKSLLQDRAVSPEISALDAMKHKIKPGARSLNLANPEISALNAMKHKIKPGSRSLNSVGGSLGVRDTLDGVPSAAGTTVDNLLQDVSARDVVSELKGLLPNVGAREVVNDAEGTLESLHLASRDVTVGGLKGKVDGLLSGMKRDMIGDAEGDAKDALFGRELSPNLQDKLKGLLSSLGA